jgi:hypothetical protein
VIHDLIKELCAHVIERVLSILLPYLLLWRPKNPLCFCTVRWQMDALCGCSEPLPGSNLCEFHTCISRHFELAATQ